MSLSIIISWLIILVIFFAGRSIFTSRSTGKLQLSLEDFSKIMPGGFVIIVEIHLLHKVATSQELMTLLGNDTITLFITLFIGASVIIFLSIQQMLKP